jgi:Fe-S cluster assembly protein SufB
MKYPSIYLMGPRPSETLSVASRHRPAGRWREDGALRAEHLVLDRVQSVAGTAGPPTAACQVQEGATRSKSTVKCDAAGRHGQPVDTYPYVDVREDDVEMATGHRL